MINLVETIFRKTKYFWIITRLIFIVVYFYTALNQISFNDYSKLAVCSFFLILVILMSLITILEFLRKKTFSGIKIFVGIINILFGILLTYLILFIVKNDGNNVFFLWLPLWFIFYGFWEFYVVKIKPTNNSHLI